MTRPASPAAVHPEGAVRLRPALGRGIVVAMVALVVGGCGPSVATRPPGASDTSARSPDAASPTNFASPTDILRRYPEMRRQVP
jgi:hypothetical protein